MSIPPPSQPPVRPQPAAVKRPSLAKRPVGKSDGALILWTVFCVLLWIIAASGGGAYAGFVVAFVVWVVPAFWLTMIYLVARAGRRRCPRCGLNVKPGRIDCGACGRVFE